MIYITCSIEKTQLRWIHREIRNGCIPLASGGLGAPGAVVGAVVWAAVWDPNDSPVLRCPVRFSDAEGED